MPISRKETRSNAIRLAREWAGAKSETVEKHTFWQVLFEVFGIRRRVCLLVTLVFPVPAA
jgi:hypothetical protein